MPGISGCQHKCRTRLEPIASAPRSAPPVNRLTYLPTYPPTYPPTFSPANSFTRRCHTSRSSTHSLRQDTCRWSSWVTGPNSIDGGTHVSPRRGASALSTVANTSESQTSTVLTTRRIRSWRRRMPTYIRSACTICSQTATRCGSPSARSLALRCCRLLLHRRRPRLLHLSTPNHQHSIFLVWQVGAVVPGTDTMCYFDSMHLTKTASEYLGPFICSFMTSSALI